MNRERTPRGSAREHILEVASELFYREGIRAVGVDTIIADANVAKMTFYKHFKSKEALIVAHLRRCDVDWQRWFTDAVERYARTPDERVLAIFDALEERATAADFRGCVFINTMVEMANKSHEAYQVAIEHKHWVQAFIHRLLAEAQIKDPALLAEQLMLLFDGALITALREGTPQAAQMAKKMAAALLSMPFESERGSLI